MRDWPALDIRYAGSPDFVLAAVDGFSPTAVEEHDDVVRVFFATRESRDAAQADLQTGPLAGALQIDAREVSDEDWARRSQDNLEPITVGRITVVPVADARDTTNRQSSIPHPSAIRIVIIPSMGFGTGHHATTRLCLAALQAIDLTNAFVLDVGSGSGVLALAADRLGASRALGIDSDPDAVQAAVDNLALNPEARRTTFDLADLDTAPLPMADVVVANITGAMLVRAAERLVAATRPGGTLILSGILDTEAESVRRAFAACSVADEAHEDEWVALTMKRL